MAPPLGLVASAAVAHRACCGLPAAAAPPGLLVPLRPPGTWASALTLRRRYQRRGRHLGVRASAACVLDVLPLQASETRLPMAISDTCSFFDDDLSVGSVDAAVMAAGLVAALAEDLLRVHECTAEHPGEREPAHGPAAGHFQTVAQPEPEEREPATWPAAYHLRTQGQPEPEARELLHRVERLEYGQRILQDRDTDIVDSFGHIFDEIFSALDAVRSSVHALDHVHNLHMRFEDFAAALADVRSRLSTLETFGDLRGRFATLENLSSSHTASMDDLRAQLGRFEVSQVAWVNDVKASARGNSVQSEAQQHLYGRVKKLESDMSRDTRFDSLEEAIDGIIRGHGLLRAEFAGSQLLEPKFDEFDYRLRALEDRMLPPARRLPTGERECSREEIQASMARTAEVEKTVLRDFPTGTRVMVSCPSWRQARLGTTLARQPGMGAARVDVRLDNATPGSDEWCWETLHNHLRVVPSAPNAHLRTMPVAEIAQRPVLPTPPPVHAPVTTPPGQLSRRDQRAQTALRRGRGRGRA